MSFIINSFLSAAYEANAVNFDGSTTKANATVTIGNSKLLTFSCWIKASTNASEIKMAGGGGTSLDDFVVNTSGKVEFKWRNSSGSGILATTANDTLASTNWTHVLISVDMADSGKRHMYINDTQQTTGVFSTYTNALLNGSSQDFAVSPTFVAAFDIADLYIDMGTYTDFSVLSNRRRFISSSLKPVDLGSDGSLPTGGSPEIYLSGDTGSWHTNKGTIGGFTESGTITTASTSPSD